jgi:predicted RecA/RadA family phage recombinase
MRDPRGEDVAANLGPPPFPPGAPSLMTVQPAPVAVYVGDGDVIEYFSAGGQNAGDVIVLGTFVGITVLFCAANSYVTVKVRGRFDIAKTAAATCNLGDKIYYHTATKTVDTTSASGINVGYAARAAVSGDTVIRCILEPNFA